jgi:hypothetical protein
MIRRGLWLAAGAALGVTGYRRASRLLRPLAGPPGRAAAAGRPVVPGRGLLAAAASAGRSTARGVAFARDVRDGMADYLDRQPVRTGRTLEGQQDGGQPGAGRPRRAGPGGQRRAARPR